MYVSGVGDRGLRVMRKGRSLFSPQNTQGKQRFQSWPAEYADHTSCWISVLWVLLHKWTEGQVRNSECHMKHEQDQNNLLTTRSRNTGTYMGEGEWATGGGESARDPWTPAARSALIAQTTSCRPCQDNKRGDSMELFLRGSIVHYLMW